MNTYNQLIHEYRKLFKEKGLPPETVKAFLFELCNDHHINLYLDLDKPMDERLYKVIDIDALSSICKDFGVSADWLLTGRGKMLKTDK